MKDIQIFTDPLAGMTSLAIGIIKKGISTLVGESKSLNRWISE